jgi:hypothetical protein
MYDSQEELLDKILLGEDSTLELKAVFFRGRLRARPIFTSLRSLCPLWLNLFHDRSIFEGKKERNCRHQ